MSQAVKRLLREYRDLLEDGADGVAAGPVEADNLFVWEALVLGPDESPYEGGCFRALLEFPQDYPHHPPKMRFDPPLWHPNVYADGRVCISILHAPGADRFGYETAMERWTPIQSVEKVLMSVTSMLAEPNCESPANVDAGKQFREDHGGFLRRVEEDVKRSLALSAGGGGAGAKAASAAAGSS